MGKGRRFLMIGGMALSLPVTAAWGYDLPSGQRVTLKEVIREVVGDEVWVRFRFLAPEIARKGGRVTFAMAEFDMLALCETVALPRLMAEGDKVAVIMISLSDRVLVFGEADPEATQYFEAYRPEGAACIWEGF